MSVTYKIESYKNYGKVLSATNGAIEVKVTVDIGPRIIYCALSGGSNVMLNDDERSITGGKDDERYEAAFGKGRYWSILGGHRIWASPEEYPLSYTPDDEPLEYTVDDNKFTFTQPLQSGTGYRIIMEVTLDRRRAALTVVNTIENHSGGIRRISPWALTVLAPGGLEIIPQPSDKYTYLSNRSLVLWPYTDMSDERVAWGRDYITLKSIDKPGTPAFKLGLNNTSGFAAYINNGTAFVKHYRHNIGGSYPDRGASFETYTADKFLEMETLGELKELLPDEACTSTERWTLYKADDINGKDMKSVAKAAEKLFKVR